MMAREAEPWSRGPMGIEWALLTLFKWLTFLLVLGFGFGFFASLTFQGLAAISIVPQAKSHSMGTATAAAFLEAPQEVDAGGSAPVFTFMPDAIRSNAYQTLYRDILKRGREANLIKDEEALVKTVNGAIEDLDSADDRENGSFAYLYLTRLKAITRDLAARKANNTRAKIPPLESAAAWLRAHTHLALRAELSGVGVSSAPFIRPGNPSLTLYAGLLFLASLSAWALLAFFAQGRVYWVVQEKHR